MAINKLHFTKMGVTCILLLLSSQIFATTIKGHILDAKSRESLIGAVISEKSLTGVNDISHLDGSFSIKGINPGRHTFIIKYLGYFTAEKDIEVSKEDVMNIDILMEPEIVTLNQVEIVAHVNNETNEYARNLEKTADNVVNVMSAKTIQLSPDLTVANVLQRVSGVTVQKTANSGEGQYAIIRGMDKRYNYTLVNGIKIPSPDDKNRYVPMDIFPAELISRLEVVKALSPEMEGDAIGGAMNIVLKDAPDKLLISANGAMGYSQIIADRSFYQFNSNVINLKSPTEMFGPDYHAKPSDFPINNLKFTPTKSLPNYTGGISFGNRFFNKKLGVIVAVSNQNSYSGADAFFASPRAQPNENNVPGFETKETRTYSTQQNRLGLHNKIDFAFNKRNKISLYSVYFQLDKYIARHSVETSLSTGVGNVVTKDKSQMQLERIYNSTLQGTHVLTDQLVLDWSAVYSKAWANYPDEVQLQYNSTVIDMPTLQSITHKWRHNNDQDEAGYLNLTWIPVISGKPVEFKAGGLYRHKNRDNYYNEYTLNPQLINNAPQTFTGIENAKFYFSGYNADLGSPVNQNDYTVTENVMAGYGEVKLTLWEKLNILTGVRVEQTSLDYNTPMPVSFIGKSGSQNYMDILPSIHFKYKLTEKQNLRLSYFKSISRPGYFEVIPYTISGEYFDEKGNPYLKRAQSQNIDFRYELFPKPTEQLFAGIFYKDISDPIEYSLVRENGPSNLQLKPQNFGNATNYGFEFVAIKYIKNFGVSANYTYTKSSITTNKGNYVRKPNVGLTTDSVSVTRPMQGQADHIANLSLLYKSQKNGLDFQLSCVYTGKYISLVSGYAGLDYWSMPNTTMDFSFEKKLNKKIKLSVYGKARNLLNSASISRIMKHNDYLTGNFALPEQDSNNSIVVQKEKYKQTYLIGLRYSF